MKERFKQFRSKYGIRILIVALSVLFLCTFIARKEGYHMDEVLAYQLANAEYNPWIVPTQPVGRLAKFMSEHIDGEHFSETLSNVAYIVKDTLANKGNSILATYKADVYEAPVWMKNTTFQNYVRCDSTDDFNLASVYFNVKDDNHPPLHFMLLHLMSSIFKVDMSPWVGCIINLLAMIGVLWLLGLIGDRLFKSKYSTYACMILFGFSVGIVAITLWVRMYALLTLFILWNLYLHLLKFGYFEENDICVNNRKSVFVEWKIFVLTVMSFWTQYFVLFFLFPLAIVTIVRLWKEKRIQRIWVYIRTLILSAVVGVLGYPFAIGDVLFSSRGTEALSTWKHGLTDYVNRLCEFLKVLAQNTAGNLLILVILILLPMAVLCLQKKKKVALDIDAKWLFVSIPTFVYFLLAAKMSPYFVDRYIMAIFPLVALLVIGLWDSAFSNVQKSGILMVCAAVIVCGLSLMGVKGTHTYLYTGYEQQLAVANTYEKYPMVCLYPGLSFYENVMEMERYEKTILLKEEELSLMTDAHKEETKEGYVLLIKFPQDNSGEAQLARVMQVFGGEDATLVYEGAPYGDAIYLVTP